MTDRSKSHVDEPLVPSASGPLLIDDDELDSLRGAWRVVESAGPLDVHTLVAYCAGALDPARAAEVRRAVTQDMQTLSLLTQVDDLLSQIRKQPLSSAQTVTATSGVELEIEREVALAWRQLLADGRAWTAQSRHEAVRDAFLAQWRAVASVPRLALSRGEGSRETDAIPSDFDDGSEALLRDAVIRADGSLSATAQLIGDQDELSKQEGRPAVLYLAIGPKRLKVAESKVDRSRIVWDAQLGAEIDGAKINLRANDLAISAAVDELTEGDAASNLFAAVRDRASDRIKDVVELRVECAAGEGSRLEFALQSEAVSVYRGGVLRVDLSTGAGWQRLAEWRVEGGEFAADVEIKADCSLAGLLRAELLVDD